MFYYSCLVIIKCEYQTIYNRHVFAYIVSFKKKGKKKTLIKGFGHRSIFDVQHLKLHGPMTFELHYFEINISGIPL